MLNIESSNYFLTLPALTQESIRQAGLDFESEEELQAFVSNLED